MAVFINSRLCIAYINTGQNPRIIVDNQTNE